MGNAVRKSILEMARGAIQERADYEMTKLIDNILDPNTPAGKKRKLTLTLVLTPDEERQTIGVSVEAKSALAPTNPVQTMLYVADEDNVVEMAPQIPGQYTMDGTEQEVPAALRLIKCS